MAAHFLACIWLRKVVDETQQHNFPMRNPWSPRCFQSIVLDKIKANHWFNFHCSVCGCLWPPGVPQDTIRLWIQLIFGRSARTRSLTKCSGFVDPYTMNYYNLRTTTGLQLLQSKQRKITFCFQRPTWFLVGHNLVPFWCACILWYPILPSKKSEYWKKNVYFCWKIIFVI